MLYDGAVTLDEDGNATIELESPLEAWKQITVTYNGVSQASVSKQDSENIDVQITGESFGFELSEDGYVFLEDEDGNPVAGEVTIKIEQADVTEFRTIYDGEVALTASGAVMGGTFDVSELPEPPFVLFIYTDSIFRVNGMADGSVISWQDSEKTYGIKADGLSTTWRIMTDNTSINSINLKIAIPAS